MKKLLFGMVFILSISVVAKAGTGICQANAENPNFEGLCRQFDSDGCQLNTRTCDWIEID